MDFVISKVAMSICGLLAVGVLAGCMDPAHLANPDHELDRIVSGFCDLVDRAVLSRSEGSLLWSVPCLADGMSVQMTISRGVVAAEAGAERSCGEPIMGIHTWQNAGAGMNISGLRLLDVRADDLMVRSGDIVVISIELVLLENEPTYLAFATRAS